MRELDHESMNAFSENALNTWLLNIILNTWNSGYMIHDIFDWLAPKVWYMMCMIMPKTWLHGIRYVISWRYKIILFRYGSFLISSFPLFLDNKHVHNIDLLCHAISWLGSFVSCTYITGEWGKVHFIQQFNFN